VFSVFLAVFMTAGFALSAVQATDMAAKMAMASDMGTSTNGASTNNACQGCPTQDSDDCTKAMSCTAACVAPVLAVLPQGVPAMLLAKPSSSGTAYPLLHGWASPPDPYPPRPTDIG